MPVDFMRGFNRLFLALIIGWAIICAVLYPLQMQFRGQSQAVSQYDKEVKNCQQLMVEAPGWDLTKNCLERAEQNQKNALEISSFKNFWYLDVAFWQLEIPFIVLPPLILYVLAMLCMWIWRGFTSSSTNQR
jgi:hypothetical protein